MNDERLRTQVLVIGSGIAGSIAALSLAEAGLSVTMLTGEASLSSGNTPLAQGGIVYRAPEDSPKQLEKDIVIAGREYNYLKSVRFVCRKGPQAVKDILVDKYGVPFDQSEGGLDLTREGGHSMPRILHCADFTGRAIMDSLLAAVDKAPNITTLTERTAVDLLTTRHHARHMDFRYGLNNQCVGAYVFNKALNRVETMLADFTILATGGAGQVYLHTTNAASSIGSGIAMAYRAGAKIMNAEYIQFHPTAMFQRKGHAERRFLVSEAVRGEGAKLVNASGEPFMSRYDPRADLAPRDVVTRAIMDEMLKTGDACVFLDAAKYVDHDLKSRFPTIYGKCKEMGVDMAKEPIPVVPAAHYTVGGVLADTRGRTTLSRLYAAGECACTGVHGANRLASVSLLEGLVWGLAAAEDVAVSHKKSAQLSRKLTDNIPDWESPGCIQNEDPALIAQDWATIRHTMWNYVGIARSTARLSRAFDDLRHLYRNLQDFYKKTPMSKPIIDLFHGCQTAYGITLAALRNTKSLGCHHRVD